MDHEWLSDGLRWTRLSQGIIEIRIDRPEVRNAISIAVSKGLARAWQRIREDMDARAVIVTSTDCGSFCAGMDLTEAVALGQREARDIMTFLADPFQRGMRQVHVPLIAAMTGSFAGGGMMLAGNCDIRIGVLGSKGGIAETKFGRGSPWAVPLLWMIPQGI